MKLPSDSAPAPLLRVLAALTGTLAVTSPAFAQQPPSAVRVAAVKSEEVQDLRQVTGDARAVQRSVVASQEEGLVLEVLVREGTAVTAGQPLVRIDPKRLELDRDVLDAQHTLAQATLQERKADAARAEHDLAALQELAKQDAVNPKELSDAQSAQLAAAARVSEAEADLAVLEARRAVLQERLDDLVPKAPFAGTVVARHTEAGQWVSAGDPLVELVSTDRLEAWLQVPQAFYAAVRGFGGQLPITLGDSGDPIPAEDWRIVPSLDPRSRTFPLIATLPAESGAAPGMSLHAAVPTGARTQQLTIPRGAILRGETGPYVYVSKQGAEGAPPTAVLIPVEILFPAGARLAVRSPGLAAGDLVVIEGNERLFPSAPLAPHEVDDAPSEVGAR